MGIYDRDYYRDGSGGLFDSWGRQGVTVWLIVITCVVFLAQAFTGHPLRGDLAEFGVYDPEKILAGEVWRLVTPIFLHSGLWHLAFNMLVLYWAGSRMEEHYGSREFLAFYLASGVLANVGFFLLHVLGVVPPTRALGASGAVTAVLVLFACHYPRQQVLLFFIIPMPVWLLVVLYVGLDALGFLGAVNRGRIAVEVHLFGALVGFLYFRSGRRLTGLLPGWPARGRQDRPRLRVLPPEPGDPAEPVGAAVEVPPRVGDANDELFEAKVDELLEKVSKYGQESLTPEEREILFRASERYKRKRK
jgi:membrane associated rhomboid family serine protease